MNTYTCMLIGSSFFPARPVGRDREVPAVMATYCPCAALRSRGWGCGDAMGAVGGGLIYEISRL